MGLNTTIMIYNDALDEIRKDKDFGEKLVAAIQRNCGAKTRQGETTDIENYGQVIEQHHANFEVEVIIGKNTGRVKPLDI